MNVRISVRRLQANRFLGFACLAVFLPHVSCRAETYTDSLGREGCRLPVTQLEEIAHEAIGNVWPELPRSKLEVRSVSYTYSTNAFDGTVLEGFVVSFFRGDARSSADASGYDPMSCRLIEVWISTNGHVGLEDVVEVDRSLDMKARLGRGAYGRVVRASSNVQNVLAKGSPIAVPDRNDIVDAAVKVVEERYPELVAQSLTLSSIYVTDYEFSESVSTGVCYRVNFWLIASIERTETEAWISILREELTVRFVGLKDDSNEATVMRRKARDRIRRVTSGRDTERQGAKDPST